MTGFPPPHGGAVTTLVLAAGAARRMGSNKLLADHRGQALVRHAVTAALAANPGRVTVVLGHEATAVRAALADLPVRFVEAVDHARGLSASLRAGLASLDPASAGVLVCLGDMPRVSPVAQARLLARFIESGGQAVVVPAAAGRRGNPVLWPRDLIPDMSALTGDQGARALLRTHAARVVEVPADDGVLLDVDTPEALAALRTATTDP